MRLNNELIVFDLEATSNQEDAAEKPAVQTNNFIIEIGAAFLDRDLKLIDTFQCLVRPEETITPFITEITSITPEMCEGQPLWKEIASEFETWIKRHCENIKRVRLSAWGTYFDMPLLRRAYARYDRPFPFSGTCIDVKTLALLWAALSGRRSDKLGVETVASAMGIQPDGRYHRALTDAVTEAKILQRVFADLEGGFFVPGSPGKPRPYYRLEKLS
jgi:inhibitor of KinA sporulation pathway (predicted exonuclease)